MLCLRLFLDWLGMVAQFGFAFGRQVGHHIFKAYAVDR